jgi:hypothetical protein
MRLDIVVNGALLAAGLGLAFWASKPADEDQEQKVDIISIEPKTIASLKLTGSDITVEAARQPGGDRFWINHTRVEKPKAPAATAPDPENPDASAEQPIAETAAAGVGETKNEKLLSNEKFEELIKSFNPLKAERVVGTIKEDQYNEFGLEGLKFKFEIVQDGGKSTHFFLGKKSYGSQNRFVMETDASGKPGRVLLISDQGFDNFEKANVRMHDRRIVNILMEDVAKAEVKAGTLTKRLAHTQKNKEGEPIWTDDEEGAAAKPSYESWMDKINKLRLATYATEEQEAQLKGTEPFLEIALEKSGGGGDKLIFRKLAGDTQQYFVYSDFLKIHAGIVTNRAEPIEKDIPTVFADAKQ